MYLDFDEEKKLNQVTAEIGLLVPFLWSRINFMLRLQSQIKKFDAAPAPDPTQLDSKPAFKNNKS
jgi:hypothetical protein